MSRHSDLELVFRTRKEIQSTKATLDEYINDQARINVLQTLSVRSQNRDPDSADYQDLISSLTQLFERGKGVLENFQTLE